MVAGTLEPLGITSFQYGTHRLDPYVLQSSTVNLGRFVGQRVIVTGRPVSGYPVSGGPVLIEVSAIEPDGVVTTAN